MKGAVKWLSSTDYHLPHIGSNYTDQYYSG